MDESLNVSRCKAVTESRISIASFSGYRRMRVVPLNVQRHSFQAIGSSVERTEKSQLDGSALTELDTTLTVLDSSCEHLFSCVPGNNGMAVMHTTGKHAVLEEPQRSRLPTPAAKAVFRVSMLSEKAYLAALTGPVT